MESEAEGCGVLRETTTEGTPASLRTPRLGRERDPCPMSRVRAAFLMRKFWNAVEYVRVSTHT